MGSGCEILIAAKLPSSARQLPILAALHARASTLFGHIIHHGEKKVNTFLKNIDKILSKARLPPGEGVVTSTLKWILIFPGSAEGL